MKWGRLLPMAACAAALAAAAAFPLFSGNFLVRFGTDVLMFAILAGAWNIIGGYTGYPSFGNVVFFGIGGYTTAVLMQKFGFHFSAAWLCAAGGAVLFAVVVGLPLLRLRGHYFAIATLGVAEAVKAVVQNLDITEGNSGIYLPMPHMPVREQYLFFYYAMLAVLAASLLVTRLVLRSRFGYALIAIREDEKAAAAVGINTTFAKTAAFALSGLFTALAGGIYAWQQAFIQPDPAFDVAVTVKMIVMAVFGGMGYLFGPLVGAVSIEGLSQLLSDWFLVVHGLFFGAVVVLVIVFTPRGVADVVARRRFRPSCFLENIRRNRI